jgi:RNA polymerase sigma-54 factor
MKQSIQLRIGQQLTMTPQLQQAIRLLQLSTLELHTEIQNALDSNPMLEQGELEAEAPDAREAGDADWTEPRVDADALSRPGAPTPSRMNCRSTATGRHLRHAQPVTAHRA